MKCPKCGYLGFEHADRCRNCGYDFSLTAAAVAPELSLRLDNSTPDPLDDLALVDASTRQPAPRSTVDAGPDLDRLVGFPAPATPREHDDELPLFGSPAPDDEPLITRASAPRQPLAVRRATPEVPRVRAEQPRMQSLDLGIDDIPVPARPRVVARGGPEHRPAAPEVQIAGIGSRFFAVAIDALILAAIDAVVVYFTLEICGITVDEFGLLPKGPLIAFLLVQNVGYLVAFTAGGQTLGKMATGIRVVPAESGMSLDLGRAFLRELMWLVLAVPAGLGFLPALFSSDRRGLHDRFAGTRVVR